MTKTLIKIIINKHSKYFACLAQSVEHSAVNRSVGGPSPSTGAKKNVKTFFFLCLFGDLYPCRTVVRRHFVPRHFFSGSPQKNCFCGVIVWTLDVANKFAVCATTRGSVLSLQEPNECEKRSFFCTCFWLVPMPHSRAASLHATTLLLDQRK